MVYIGLFAWLIFLIIMFVSMHSWWYILLLVISMIFAAYMDKKTKRWWDQKNKKPDNQAPDDFEPV